MKLLLTSGGIKNASIHNALLDLLGKPIAESSALCIPTASYGHSMVTPVMAWQFISGQDECPMVELGWKSVGILELTALPSIEKERWVSWVQAADVLLVNGGDPMYLCYWMRQSGLADLLPSLDVVWVGLSAGSMIMTRASARTLWAGSHPLVAMNYEAAMKRWASSISRSSRTWITKCCPGTRWPMRKNGRLGSAVRRMRSMMRPPSKLSTAPLK
ncbi:MAG: Type 1 glutamine amidotransferase-like domain-containing protein [Caldilineaceae bacterium]